jgi:hypothetical protein
MRKRLFLAFFSPVPHLLFLERAARPLTGARARHTAFPFFPSRIFLFFPPGTASVEEADALGTQRLHTTQRLRLYYLLYYLLYYC